MTFLIFGCTKKKKKKVYFLSCNSILYSILFLSIILATSKVKPHISLKCFVCPICQINTLNLEAQHFRNMKYTCTVSGHCKSTGRHGAINARMQGHGFSAQRTQVLIKCKEWNLTLDTQCLLN